MITWGFFFGAFLSTLLASRRSLGMGLLCAIGVGYFNGVIRANYLGVATTFMFDAAMLGLYLGVLVYHPQELRSALRSSGGTWCLALIAWAMLMALLPVNDLLVQFVALRATIWFLPALLVASRLLDSDLVTLARGLAVLNLVALAVGGYLYVFGVEALYPYNSVTHNIYMSRDVEGGYFRIPSTFLSSHAYGGTMMCSLPLLLGALMRGQLYQWERPFLLAGILAAFLGILLCAARQPVVVGLVVLVFAWVRTGFSARLGVTLAVTALVGVYLVTSNERFQRILTLQDTEYIADRIHNSLNENFLDLLVEYPFGAGMGSSVGTSIPYFLADVAPIAIGLENEYCRILIDQGWIGLGLWLGFIVWTHTSGNVSRDSSWEFGIAMMYGLSLATWCTAFMGCGTTSSIPATVLLLLNMGVVIGRRRLVYQARFAHDISTNGSLQSTGV